MKTESSLAKSVRLKRRDVRPLARPEEGMTDSSHAQQASRILMTVEEAAELLRTSPRAIYAMKSRGQLPGVTSIGRRILFRTDDLLDWLDQKSAPSPGGRR